MLPNNIDTIKTAQGARRTNKTTFIVVLVILRLGNSITINIAKNINNTPAMKEIRDNLPLNIGSYFANCSDTNSQLTISHKASTCLGLALR